MKRLLAASTLTLIALTSASAAETKVSTMNQAGVYEQTMKFYLHPAHGFPGVANYNSDHPAVMVYRAAIKSAPPAMNEIFAHAGQRRDRCRSALCRARMQVAHDAQPDMALATQIASHLALAQPTAEDGAF